MHILKRFYRGARQEIRYLVHLFREWRCRRARAYLLRHDTDYQFAAVGNELIRRRNEARERGIGPADPKYPTRKDVHDDFGINDELGMKRM